jgi:micrococcal nuclease
MARTRPKLTRSQRKARYAGRRLLIGLAVAAVAGALILADRTGLLGTAARPDVEVYDGKTFRCVHVVDGDTLDVDAYDAVRHRRTTRVRLWGVDTPETVKPDTPPQHFGAEATAFARGVADGRSVRLELFGEGTRDKYQRLLAYVHLPDGRMLNRELVAQGYGYADPRFEHPRKAEFARLERAAREARLGLWQGVTDADLPYYHPARRE